MMRWVLRITALVLILAIGAAGYVVFGVSVDTLKRKVEKEVAKVTGRELVISGDVERHWSLAPAITLHDISLANPSWAKEQKLLTAKNLTVKVQLLPLLNNKITLSKLELEGVALNPEVSKSDQISWELAKKAAPKVTAPESKTEKKTNGKTPDDTAIESQPAKARPVTFHIDRLWVRDAIATYYDHGTKQKKTLTISDLTINNLNQSGMESFDLKGVYRKQEVALTGSLSDKELLMISGVIQGKSINAQAEGSLSLNDSTFDAAVQVRAEQTKKMLALFDIKSPITSAVTMQGNIGGTPDVITLKSFDVQAEQTKATFDGAIDLSKKTPSISGAVQADRVVIAPLASPTALPTDVSSATDTKAADASAQPLDLSWINDVRTSLRVGVGELQYGDMLAKNIKGTLDIKDQALAFVLSQAQLSDGTVKGSLDLSVAQAVPGYQLYLWTDDVVLGQLWAAIADDAIVTDGRTKAALRLGGQGATLEAMLRTAKGYARFFVGDLLYKVPDSVAEVKSFVQVLRGRKDEKRTLKVKCGLGRFTIENGVATSKALAIKTSGAIAKGSGKITLADETVDMVIKARSEDVGLVDVVPPLRVKGALDNPSVYPDTAGTLLDVGKLVLGATSGVGLVAVLGEKAADRLGITDDNDPCLNDLTEEADEAAAAPANGKAGVVQGSVAKPVPAIKEVERAIKSDVQNLKEGVKNLLGR